MTDPLTDREPTLNEVAMLATIDSQAQEIATLRGALERIGRGCGNDHFVANQALGYGYVAHPDLAALSPQEGTDK